MGAVLPSLKQEVLDFLRFLRRPRPGPRLGGRRTGQGVWTDFALNARVGRLIQWAILLWLVNLFVFAPMAVTAIELGGAMHRLNVYNLPWLKALIWAPIVEELTFRYVLRRPAVIWWFVPLMVAALFIGAQPMGVALLGIVLLLVLPQWRLPRCAGACRLAWPARRRAHRLYPWLFHASALSFAAVHLFNFTLGGMPWLLMPLLVLPQWATGLVLGWLRVRRGIGASMALHAIFNSGPLILIAVALHFAPSLVS